MILRRSFVLLLAALFMLTLAACGKDDPAAPVEETEAASETAPFGLVNPWAEADEAAVKAKFGITFSVPDSAKDVSYRIADSLGIAEMRFTLDGVEWNARIAESEEFNDVSGMNYVWQKQEKAALGKISGSVRTCVADGKNVGVGLWHNPTLNMMFTLSASSEKTLDFSIAGLVFPVK